MSRDFKQLMKEQFGELTITQMWALVNFSKNVRLRCRNNTAFNNFCNQTFPYARFQQVTKQRVDKYTGQLKTYPGLQITVNGQTVENEESEE